MPLPAGSRFIGGALGMAQKWRPACTWPAAAATTCSPSNADWMVDGPDILAAIRTAYDGAHSFHDS